MLQDIRDNAQGIVAKVIIGFIILSFSLFGVDSLIGSGGPAPAATINGEEISIAQLERAMEIQKAQLLSRMGAGADPSLLDDNFLRGPALDRLIQRQLLLQAAEDASVGVSGSLLDQSIVSMPQFQQDGQFSPLLYKNILRSNGFTPANFKSLVSDDMVISQINNGLSGSDFVTQSDLADIATIIGQKRSFRYFLLPLEKVSQQLNITDEEIDQFYSSNSDQFRTEDRVKLAYIEITQQDFFKPVSDEDLTDAYEQEMEAFEADEERRAAHILIEITDQRSKEEAKALITKLADRIKNGDAFQDLVEQFSDDTGSARSAGDLGYTKGDAFPPEFEDALFTLSLNQISEPVLTDAGYHLITATEIKDAERPSFDDLKPVLQQRLQLTAAETDFIRSVEELRDRVFNSEDLSGPASELNLSVSSSDWLSRTTAAGVLANPQVLAAAYSSDVLEDNNNSEVLELARDHFIVLRVLEHDAPHIIALAEVKSSIEKQLKAQKSSELALKLAETSIAELAAGKSIEELATEQGYEWQLVTDVTRNSNKVNRSILSNAFEMSLAEANAVSRVAVDIGAGNIAVLQLEKVVDGSLDDFSSDEQRGIRAELQRNSGQKSFNAFIAALRNAAEIEVL